MNILQDAKIVRFDLNNQLLLVWSGGWYIRVHRFDSTPTLPFNLGGKAIIVKEVAELIIQDPIPDGYPSYQKVKTRMRQAITNNELSRYKK